MNNIVFTVTVNNVEKILLHVYWVSDIIIIIWIVRCTIDNIVSVSVANSLGL